MNIPRIMLVDEAEFFIDLEKQFLKDSLLEVVTLTSYQAVADELGRCRPDLLFMDIGAPGMDGVKVCSWIKQQPLFSAVPVVLIYGLKFPNEKQLCLDAGCHGVLSKPLDRKSFLSMGRKFLPGIERRVQRVLCSTTVFFRSDSHHHYAASMDISEGGMFLETDYPGQNQELVDLAFNLPGNASQILEVRGRVVWVNSKSKLLRPSYPIGFGLEFVSPSATAVELIRKYVAENAPLQELIRSGHAVKELGADKLIRL